MEARISIRPSENIGRTPRSHFPYISRAIFSTLVEVLFGGRKRLKVNILPQRPEAVSGEGELGPLVLSFWEDGWKRKKCRTGGRALGEPR
jgi:hypothetical protein